MAICVSLADKLDMLVGFWAIDEKPTGSKDPYALRRAALGVIRTVLEKGLTLRLGGFMPAGDLLAFFHDRLKVQLRDSGARHDLVDAVLSGGALTPPRDPSDRDPPPQGEGEAAPTSHNDDLLDVTRRVEALGAFLATEDGANLLAGYRRAANILAAEEKKGTAVAAEVDLARLAEPEEKLLAAAIDRAEIELADALQTANYEQAMAGLAKLRLPVDAFFEAVLVNAEDEAVRANRLALLARIRAACGRVADFSRIAG